MVESHPGSEPLGPYILETGFPVLREYSDSVIKSFVDPDEENEKAPIDIDGVMGRSGSLLLSGRYFLVQPYIFAISVSDNSTDNHLLALVTKVCLFTPEPSDLGPPITSDPRKLVLRVRNLATRMPIASAILWSLWNFGGVSPKLTLICAQVRTHPVSFIAVTLTSKPGPENLSTEGFTGVHELGYVSS